MSDWYSTEHSPEDALAVVPCRLCGDPISADTGKLVCASCASKQYAVQYAAHARNRSARQKGNGGSHTAADVRAQYDYQGGRCFYCGVEVGDKYHVDHFMPIALGGSNGPENLVIACPACNIKKSASHPIAFCVGLDIERAL